MEILKESEVQGVGDNTATCTCQQCNENLHIQDTRPTYNPSGEIVGRICNHCRIKNVEYARKCQILGCTAPESKNTGFRTLPAKFYDLEQGEVKIRIVKQFGITESTRACCNMCYLRISKAIVQMKIVYGDGIIKSDLKKKTVREIKSTVVGSAGSRVFNNKEVPVGATQDMKESRASCKSVGNEQHKSPSKYTGPQFKRKFGSVHSWLQQHKVRRVDGEETEETQTNSSVNNEIVGTDGKDGIASIDVDSKVKDMGVHYENPISTAYFQPQNCQTDLLSESADKSSLAWKDISFSEARETPSRGTLVPHSKSTNSCLGGVFSAGGIVVRSNVSKRDQRSQLQNTDNLTSLQQGKVTKYSTVPISPTTTRFCRILPKPSELIQDKLATTVGNQLRLDSTRYVEKVSGNEVEQVDESSSEDTAKSESKDTDEGDSEEASSGDTVSSNQSERTPDKLARKKRCRRSDFEAEITSDIVSCMGCHKICSVREAKPVFDYEKGFCGRLCNECRIKKREDNKKCPIKGCKTLSKDVVLKPVPPRVHKLKGKAKQKFIVEYGLTKDTKVCCRMCWKKINMLLKNVRLKSKQLKSCKTSGNELSQAQEGLADCRKYDRSETARLPEENVLVEATDKVQSFVMCRSCCCMVPVNAIVASFGDNGKRREALCYPCSGMSVPISVEKGDRDSSARKSDGYKVTGVCRVKGCVCSGHVVSLVSCERLLKASEHEEIARSEFDLDDDNNFCCRSCLARIKWFINAYTGKKTNQLRSAQAQGNKPSSKNQLSDVQVQEAEVQCGTTLAQVQKTRPHGLHPTEKVYTQSIMPAATLRSNESVTGREMPVMVTKGLVDEWHLHDTLPQRHFQTLPNNCRVPDALNAPQSVQEGAFQLVGNAPFRSNSGTSPGNMAPIHPPVLQVGGQQFVLNVIRRLDQDTQTESHYFVGGTCEKEVQCYDTLQLNTLGQVGSARRVTYLEAKEKTKYIIKKQGRQLFDQFLEQLNEISGGFGKQLLQDVYFPKETVMAINYEKILASLGAQYHDTEKTNKTEKLRILSLVALYASNELLKKHFQRPTKKGELTSVTEGEIAQAREYAKQFGPGAFVMPEKVAELSKNKGMLISPGECKTECKPEEDFHPKEAAVSVGTVPQTAFMSPVTPTTLLRETPETKVESIVVTSVPGRVATSQKSCDVGKDNVTDTRVTSTVDMLQLKIVKSISGVPVVDFGTNLPTKSQISPANVPLIAKFKYKPSPPPTSSEKQETMVFASAENSHQISNMVLSKADTKDRIHKKLKKKFMTSPTSPRKIMEDREKVKKATSCKLKFFKKQPGILGDSSDSRGKRMRTSFTREEREMLEKYFKHSMYVTKDLMKVIQGQMGLDKKKIDTWFRNRRSKAKKAEYEKCGEDGISPFKVRRDRLSSDSFVVPTSDDSMSVDLSLEKVESPTDGKRINESAPSENLSLNKPGFEGHGSVDQGSQSAVETPHQLGAFVQRLIRPASDSSVLLARNVDKTPAFVDCNDKSDSPVHLRYKEEVSFDGYELDNDELQRLDNEKMAQTISDQKSRESVLDSHSDSTLDSDRLQSNRSDTESQGWDFSKSIEEFDEVTEAVPKVRSVTKKDSIKHFSQHDNENKLGGNHEVQLNDNIGKVKQDKGHGEQRINKTPKRKKCEDVKLFAFTEGIKGESENGRRSLSIGDGARGKEHSVGAKIPLNFKKDPILEEHETWPTSTYTDKNDARSSREAKSPTKRSKELASVVESGREAQEEGRGPQKKTITKSKNDAESLRSCKKDSVESSRSIRGDIGTPRSSKRELADTMRGIRADSPRASRKDNHEKKGHRYNTEAPRPSRKDLNDGSGRDSKLKIVSKKAYDEEKSALRRKRRARIEMSDDKDSADEGPIEEQEESAISAVTGKHRLQDTPEKLGNGTTYETRSKAR